MRIVKILIVEDEEKTVDYLRKGLTESAYVVDSAMTGIDGLHHAIEGDYDLVILDVMLPGMDGLEVLRRLRECKDTPVLILTALDDVADRVRGLESGGDDYLIKPFAFVELLARVRTLMRRGPLRDVEHIEVGDLEIDIVRHRVIRAGRRIDLTPREFCLLHFLAARQGQVLNRALLATQVWDMNFESDTNVVDVAVRRLRAKVDDEFAHKLIHTVRGVGYLLESRRS